MIGRRDNRYEEIVQEFDHFFHKVQELYKDGSVPAAPLAWGYAYLRGLDGNPHLTHFGSLLDEASLAEGVFEPRVSASFDAEQGLMTIEVEMPGAEKGSIHVVANDGELRVEGSGSGRRYLRLVPVPKEYLPDSAKAKFRDGLLHLILEQVKVEKLGYEIPVA